MKKKRIFKKKTGTETKPRICVFKSNKHIYLQAINDKHHHTLGSSSTLEANIKTCTLNTAKKIGQIMGEILKNKNINLAFFDKNKSRYHGKVAALADALRIYGIKI